jgi:hypothetical protein
MAQAEFSGTIVAVAVLLMAGSALAANECAGLPHAHPHSALGDFFVGAGVATNPEAHEQEQRGIAARGALTDLSLPLSLRYLGQSSAQL